MEWLVEIRKNSVTLKCDGQTKNVYEIYKKWSVLVDKLDDFILIKAKNNDNSIHLCMLPSEKTSVIWFDIYESYKQFEN